jgi:WD40 repeat protein/DNA-binding winged helix-turn-helix (wHTH) protein
MTSGPSSRRFYRFGEFRLDVRSGELYRDELPVRLPPQPAKLLLRLVEARGELVTRDEVQKALWGDDTVVDYEQGINKAIKQVRAALEDLAEEPAYIQTVPRRGYRFVGEVQVEGPEPRIHETERRPYPGLSAYTEREAPFFFGREEEIEALWRKVETKRVLALMGPSGAGKSSLLHAGLLPRQPPGWRTLIVRLRESPFTALAQALDAELGRSTGGSADPEAAFGLLQQWRRAHPEVLLCIDAFEELFTLNDETTRERFSALIGRSAQEIGVHTLLAMRDDFLIQCHDYPELEQVFSDLTPLKPPRGPGLRRALVEPALKCGYRFEDEALVGEILAEVTKERGAFPLLAFAAACLWEKRDRARKLLTREAYLEIGGVGGALAQHAEQTFTQIGYEREPVVREMFRNLTTSKGTRATQDREELLSVFEDRQGAWTVLQKLIDARLLTSTDREVELVHESLLSAWPRLVRWQAQAADGAVLSDQLRHAARAWEERHRSDDLLWLGAAYRDLAQWRDRYARGLTATEQAFAEASKKHAERTRRRKRIARGSLLAAALAVAAITSWLWQRARVEALRAEASKLLALAEVRLQEDPTEALAFATASLELADTEEARVFAMKALWEGPPVLELAADSQAMRVPAFSPDGKWLAAAGHAGEALVWSEDGRGPIVLPGHDTSPRGSNFPAWASKDLLLTGMCCSIASRVHLWSLPEGKRSRTIDFGQPSDWQTGPHMLLAETLESGSPESPGLGLLRSWKLPDGEPEILGRVDWSELGTSTTFFAPDGSGWLYAKGGNLHSRPLPVGTAPDGIFARLGGDVANYNVGPNALAVTDESGLAHLWSFRHEGPVREKAVRKPDAASDRMLLDTSGRWLGEPVADRQVRLWSSTGWKAARPLSLRRSVGWYLAVRSFHPTGDWAVASTSGFTRLTFWPLSRSYPLVVDGYATMVRPVAFSPDGNWLATDWPGAGGRLRLWPLPENGVSEVRSLELPDATFTIRSLAFDPKGRYLFAVGSRDQAWILPMDGSAPRKLQAFSEDTQLHAAAVSPSGRRVATAFSYGLGEKSIRMWDLETGELRRFELPASESDAIVASETGTGYERGVSSLGFADESTLYSAGDGGLRRWNLESGSSEIVAAASSGRATRGAFVADRGVAITGEWRMGRLWNDCPSALLHDLGSGVSRELTKFGDCGAWSRYAIALDPSGSVAAIGSVDGIVRVGSLPDGEPHLLVGHKGAVDSVAISPDLRWVATTGEDDTLRLWPLPDLSRPPLHTLPHDELLAKLRSLTNLRVIRDPSSAIGWKVDVDTFPGWRNLPVW